MSVIIYFGDIPRATGDSGTVRARAGSNGIIKITVAATGGYQGNASRHNQVLEVKQGSRYKRMSCITGGTSRYGGDDGYQNRVSWVLKDLTPNQEYTFTWSCTGERNTTNCCGSWLGL